MLTKPLRRCANGCWAPPHPPSKVLCQPCFARIGDKIRVMIERLKARGER